MSTPWRSSVSGYMGSLKLTAVASLQALKVSVDMEEADFLVFFMALAGLHKDSYKNLYTFACQHDQK